jgi:hypothetical protein
MTAGRAGHSLRIRFDFLVGGKAVLLAVLDCLHSLRDPPSLRETPRGSRLDETDRPNQLEPGGGMADRRAALFLRRCLDLSRPSATATTGSFL